MIHFSTIVSVATPLSHEGAIGIIRISGERALELVDRVFISKKLKKLSFYPVQRMVYGHLCHESKIYDEVLAVYFKAPYSYTGEDVVEVHCHGNIASLMQINSLFISLGAQPAQPGEFTKRAFLNGRLDLSQAESVMELISAKTLEGFDMALGQLSGGIGKKIEEKSEILTDLLARIEVTIDYPDEDIEFLENEKILCELEVLSKSLEDLLSQYNKSKILRDGINIAIVGAPNVGKSSFMNYLLNEDRAIVTDVPGTTRDILSEWVSIAGVPVKVIDTAGLRETDDIVEKIGVDRTKRIFNQADLIILMLAADRTLSDDEIALLTMSNHKKTMILVNKTDLDSVLNIADVRSLIDKAEILQISLKNLSGLENFEESFLNIVGSKGFSSKDGEFAINQRQQSSILRAKESIENAINALNAGMTLDIIEVDLINAYSALGEVSGKTVDEDVINRIFEKFCLGK